MKDSKFMIPLGDVELTIEEYENSMLAEEFELTLKPRNKATKGDASSKLNVRFKTGIHTEIASIADELGLDKSKIAQAAIAIGLKQIKSFLSEDNTEGARQTKGLIEVSKVRHDLWK